MVNVGQTIYRRNAHGLLALMTYLLEPGVINQSTNRSCLKSSESTGGQQTIKVKYTDHAKITWLVSGQYKTYIFWEHKELVGGGHSTWPYTYQ